MTHHTVRDLRRLFSASAPLPALAFGDLLTTAREGLVFDVVPAPRDGARAADTPPPVMIPALASEGLALAPIPGPLGFDVRAFGARGDNRQDDTAALQHAIDTALYGPVRAPVSLPPGRFILTDTLHLGYGTTFTGLTFTGAGRVYRGNAHRFAGTVLVARQTDRPALNIQAARGTIVSGLTLLGEAGAIMAEHGMGHPLRATRPDTTLSDWVDPALPPSAASRYAPYAGLTIDAYGGEPPSPAYPDVALPAFAGADGQYGKRTSSNVQLRDMVISGFVVGVAVQPADVDANGDFTAINNLLIERCVYAVSVGNSQSRNVAIRDSQIHQVFCAFTNNTHGRQRGHFGGSIDNVSMSFTTNIFQFGTSAYVGPLTVQNLYAESTYRIGDIASVTGNETAVIVQASVFKLGAQTDLRGVPASSLSLGGAPFAMRFVGCSFAYPQFLVIAGAPAHFEDCRLARRPQGGPLARNRVADQGLRAALNATASGLLIGPDGFVPDETGQSLLWRPYEALTGVRLGAATSLAREATEGPTPLTIHTPDIVRQGIRFATPTPHMAVGPALFERVEVDLNGDGAMVTATLAGAEMAFGAPQMGDIIIVGRDSEAVLVVEERKGPTVRFRQISPTGGAASSAPAPLTMPGTLIVTRRVALPAPMRIATAADHTDARLVVDEALADLLATLAPGAWVQLAAADRTVFGRPPRIVDLNVQAQRITFDRPARETKALMAVICLVTDPAIR
ncbi:MAG: glycosyl hydrolase family 28-related protein [Pseudomonadota bacterium]